MKKKIKAVLSSVGLLAGFLTMQMIIPLIIGIYYGVSRNLAGKEIDPVTAGRLGQSSLSIIMMQILGVLFLLAVFKIKKTKIKEYIAIKKLNF